MHMLQVAAFDFDLFYRNKRSPLMSIQKASLSWNGTDDYLFIYHQLLIRIKIFGDHE